LTYGFRENRFNKTRFSCDAVSEPGVIRIDVAGCMEGEGFEGMPQERNYYFTVHCDRKPTTVSWASAPDTMNRLREIAATDDLQGSIEGWSHERARGGVLHIKLKPLAFDAVITIDIR